LDAGIGLRDSGDLPPLSSIGSLNVSSSNRRATARTRHATARLVVGVNISVCLAGVGAARLDRFGQSTRCEPGK
jgi:hypothetical protein